MFGRFFTGRASIGIEEQVNQERDNQHISIFQYLRNTLYHFTYQSVLPEEVATLEDDSSDIDELSANEDAVSAGENNTVREFIPVEDDDNVVVAYPVDDDPRVTHAHFFPINDPDAVMRYGIIRQLHQTMGRERPTIEEVINIDNQAMYPSAIAVGELGVTSVYYCS